MIRARVTRHLAPGFVYTPPPPEWYAPLPVVVLCDVCKKRAHVSRDRTNRRLLTHRLQWFIDMMRSLSPSACVSVCVNNITRYFVNVDGRFIGMVLSVEYRTMCTVRIYLHKSVGKISTILHLTNVSREYTMCLSSF